MRLRLFLVILLIIGFLATFYTPGIAIKVSTALYARSASPLNFNWTGTSFLVSVLEDDGYDVVIINTTEMLSTEVEKGGVVLLIAPDHVIDDKYGRDIIVNGLANGNISLAVFDENTTSNPVLSPFGVVVDGRALFDANPNAPQYPLATVNGPEDNTIVVRLNWASVIRFTNRSGFHVRITSFAWGLGVLDYNDNGRLDELELQEYNRYIVGVMIDLNNGSRIMVFTDSFPVLNVALTRNYTLSGPMIEYIERLADEKNKRVIIPNFVYRKNVFSITVPFHVSILYIFFASYMNSLDKIIDSYISTNIMLRSILTLLLIVGIGLILRSLLRITNYKEYEATPVDEVVFFAETPITESLLKGRSPPGTEKQYIQAYWRILSSAYEKILGIKLNDVLDKPDEIAKLASTIGMDSEELMRRLKWLSRIYLKASGKKVLLPIVISWKRTLKKYVEQTDLLLNRIGYTLTRRAEYRDVLYLLK